MLDFVFFTNLKNYINKYVILLYPNKIMIYCDAICRLPPPHTKKAHLQTHCLFICLLGDDIY